MRPKRPSRGKWKQQTITGWISDVTAEGWLELERDIAAISLVERSVRDGRWEYHLTISRIGGCTRDLAHEVARDFGLDHAITDDKEDRNPFGLWHFWQPVEVSDDDRNTPSPPA